MNGKDQAIKELLQNGKLGKVHLQIDQDGISSKYYVPYTVVVGFPTGVSPAARKLWDAVREEYYVYRR